MGASAFLVAGSALNAYSDLSGAKTEAAADRAKANFEQSTAETNASMADYQASDAVARGVEDVRKVNDNVTKVIGAQRVGMAGQGVDVNSGSAADVQSETATLGKFDALTVHNNATREAFGFNSEASDLRYQGRFAQLAGQNASKNTLLTGNMRAVGDILKGASDYVKGAKG